MKHLVGNILATLLAVVVGLGTMWASNRYLKEPQGAIDWVVLVLSGITTGTLIFFVVWGHFQDDPTGAEEQGTQNGAGLPPSSDI